MCSRYASILTSLARNCMHLRYSIENHRLLFKRCKPSTFFDSRCTHIRHQFASSKWATTVKPHSYFRFIITDTTRITISFTTSIKDGRFNCVHGDYICEWQNGEIKGSGGPIKGVLNNSTTTFNTWLRTRHIGAEMQKQVKDLFKSSRIHTFRYSETRRKRQQTK